MIKAVLLDLDNTLLYNPDRVFAQEFVRLADSYFQEHLSLPKISETFRRTMRLVQGKRDLSTSLGSVLTQFVAQEARQPEETVSAVVNKFYKETFPSLKSCVQVLADAKALIQTLISSDLKLVVATNPLYPESAIIERLKWAELYWHPEMYAFISNAQNMHFMKPSLAFYAELLARVGIEPDEAIMVGDSLENDILPAIELGIHAFHIRNTPETLSSENLHYDQGSLEDFEKLVGNQRLLQQLSPIPKTPEMIEPQFLGNIGALYGMVEGIPAHYWHQHPDPNEWSPLQVLCHLAESEDAVQRPRLEHILAEDNPFLSAPKTPPGPAQYECDLESSVYLERFVESRQKTINLLRSIPPKDWYRPARHSIFGPTNFLEMAYFTAQHDRLHLKQLCQTLGKCE